MISPNTTEVGLSDSTSRSELAERNVGRFVRVARKDGWQSDQWAIITMVVISKKKLCWLVEYSNGATDVVRIFDNPDHFDVSDTPSV
jgi:hypothetical protein